MATYDDVSRCQWLFLVYLIVDVPGALPQRPCRDSNGFIEASSYFLENHPTAYPMQYGDCSFGQSLCNYTQFCTDQDAESWRQNGDHAECPGKTGRYESFSVLVSPLLDISHVTCLTFEYTQEPPGQLSVYLATTTSLFIIMPEEVRQKQGFVNFTTVLSSTTGKLMFRARTPDVNHSVQLRAVKLQQGSCTGSGFVLTTCLFERDYLPSSCGWSMNNWNITAQLSAPESTESISDAASIGYFAYVIHPIRKGTLTTIMAQPTGNQTGCLEFSYILCGPDSRLLVSIETLDGNRRVLWSGPPNTSTDCLKTWKLAQVPVSSTAAFAIHATAVTIRLST
ncbi:MAM and LDL-receptor class A domain-containing protein 1-like isoform X2 [Pomacea canaliculata]|uniref:MAM and LDL-receptor class A domain-containing protein 1-like isoform X2 n=1 Tax=Pomacea canaliculata TaxID=400727 RepID=UPI000D738C9B|nr:MAM and LDL-receptor class A domain-containing protein 1-like isoform X2 [Pomacea canaliculata]